MVIHAAMHWSEVSAKHLWTFSSNYVTYLHNITHRKDTVRSLYKIWYGAVSNHEKLRVAQTWGCNTYLLYPNIQNNIKHPSSQQGLGEDSS